MPYNREQEIEEAAVNFSKRVYKGSVDKNLGFQDFKAGAEWADNHPDMDNKIKHARRLEQQLGTAWAALEEIANEDFRGNRSSASVKAYKAIEKINELNPK
jgi:hypothetical protein